MTGSRRKERQDQSSGSFSAFKNLQIYTETNKALAAQLMRFSHLGIISFGPLLVEAMAAELPVLLINSTEADEAHAAKALNGVFAGAGKTFGYSSQTDWDAFRRELAYLLERPREIERMQTAAHRVVDGQGAQRIARYICKYVVNRGKGSLSLQDASLQDASLALPSAIMIMDQGVRTSNQHSFLSVRRKEKTELRGVL